MNEYLCTVYYYDWSFVAIFSSSNEAEAKRKFAIKVKRKTGLNLTEFIKVRNLDNTKINTVYEV